MESKNTKEMDVKVKELFDSLTPEQLKSLQEEFNKGMDEILKSEVEKLESFKSELEIVKQKRKELKEYFKDYYNTPISFLSQEEREEIGRVSVEKNDTERQLIIDEANLISKILSQQNVIKCFENGGMTINVSDQDGFEYQHIPDFRKIDTTEFDFDEKTVNSLPTPKYIPFIDEEKFRSKSYIFDSIRVTEDSYLISINGYNAKSKDSNIFVIVTLDQLVLIIDYYIAKIKAKNIEDARLQNERSRESYFKLSEEKRRYYMFQRGIYRNLSASDKKKISEDDFEKLGLEEREKYYLPINKYGVKKIVSKIEGDEMPGSFHRMYQDFINKEAIQRNKDGVPDINGRYANPIVWKYWTDFREMIKFKIKDIRIQREDYSDTYKQAIETSFGESNVDDALKEQYGILVKRQNGDKIKPNEIELIKESWIEIQSVYGNLKAEALKHNLKISHSGEKLMFAMKVLGVYIPQMGTIGVSNKFGETDFKSTFSHETAHFIDNFIGELNGKRWATDNYESLAGKIAFEFRNSMNKNKSEQSDYINATKECFARAMQQYFGMKFLGEDSILMNVDNKISTTGIEIHRHPNFVNKISFQTYIVPMIEQFLKENLDVFETTVDIDGTNDLASITEEENRLENISDDEYIIGQELTGEKVRDIVSKYSSREDTDMNEFANENISKDTKYEVKNLKIKDIISNDINLSEYINDTKKDYLKGKFVDFKKTPILLGEDDFGNKNIVKDGYGRITQLYVNGEEDIYAFVPIEKEHPKSEQSIQELIEGFEVMAELSEGAEKKEYEELIEGLKLLASL